MDSITRLFQVFTLKPSPNPTNQSGGIDLSEGNRVTNLPHISPPRTQNDILNAAKTVNEAQQKEFMEKVQPEASEQLQDWGFPLSTNTTFNLLSNEWIRHRAKAGQSWTGTAINNGTTNTFKFLSLSHEKPLILHFQKVLSPDNPATNTILDSDILTGNALRKGEGLFKKILGNSGLYTPIKVRDSQIFLENPNYLAVHNYPRFHSLADDKYEYVHIIFDIRAPENFVPVSLNLYEGDPND